MFDDRYHLSVYSSIVIDIIILFRKWCSSALYAITKLVFRVPPNSSYRARSFNSCFHNLRGWLESAGIWLLRVPTRINPLNKKRWWNRRVVTCYVAASSFSMVKEMKARESVGQVNSGHVQEIVLVFRNVGISWFVEIY